MDVNLPGVDELEATRRIRALAGVPVAVLVSSPRDDFGADLLRCGAAAYVTKSGFGADRLPQIWGEARG